jgi:predicted ATPase with chaperone activity
MPLAHTAKQQGFSTIYVPAVDAAQAALVSGIDVIPLDSLGQLVEHLYGMNPISSYVPVPTPERDLPPEDITDFADISGQTYSLLKLHFTLKRTLNNSSQTSITVEFQWRVVFGEQLN